MRLGQAGVRAHRHFGLCLRLVETVGAHQRQGVIVQIAAVGTQLDGALEVEKCLCEIAFLGQDPPAQIPRRIVERIGAQCILLAPPPSASPPPAGAIDPAATGSSAMAFSNPFRGGGQHAVAKPRFRDRSAPLAPHAPESASACAGSTSARARMARAESGPSRAPAGTRRRLRAACPGSSSHRPAPCKTPALCGLHLLRSAAPVPATRPPRCFPVPPAPPPGTKRSAGYRAAARDSTARPPRDTPPADVRANSTSAFAGARRWIRWSVMITCGASSTRRLGMWQVMQSAAVAVTPGGVRPRVALQANSGILPQRLLAARNAMRIVTGGAFQFPAALPKQRDCRSRYTELTASNLSSWPVPGA